jgi:hypothetical protein
VFISQQKSPALHRVAECLYRNGNGNYVALVKVKGKQIKKSLKTIDRKIANRRLADLRDKAQRLYGSENRNIRFGEFAEIWLESVKPDLKVASHQRRATAIEGLRPFFEGIQVRSIGVTEIERWKKQRGAHIAARTHNIELETLSLIFRYAKRRGIILENPCDDFNRRKEIQRQVETLSRGQFCQLMEELRNSSKAVGISSSARPNLRLTARLYSTSQEVSLRSVEDPRQSRLLAVNIRHTPERHLQTQDETKARFNKHQSLLSSIKTER